MSEYEVYWLKDFPLINSWACLERIIIFPLKRYALIIKKQTNKYKEKFIILQSIGIIFIKVRKQGWSPTPADIVVGI